MNIDESVLKRFQAKVSVSDDGCWHWIAALNRLGYGWLRVGGRMQLAHRVSWCLYNKDKLDGLVLHRCDVPRCVNPAHLFVGTNADNMSDMKAKGRRKGICNGEKHGRHKITEAQVQIIRNSSTGARTLAKQLGVGRDCVRKVRLGLTWGWLKKEKINVA